MNTFCERHRALSLKQDVDLCFSTSNLRAYIVHVLHEADISLDELESAVRTEL